MWVQERNSAVKSGLKFHHDIVGQADLLKPKSLTLVTATTIVKLAMKCRGIISS